MRNALFRAVFAGAMAVNSWSTYASNTQSAEVNERQVGTINLADSNSLTVRNLLLRFADDPALPATSIESLPPSRFEMSAIVFTLRNLISILPPHVKVRLLHFDTSNMIVLSCPGVSNELPNTLNRINTENAYSGKSRLCNIPNEVF